MAIAETLATIDAAPIKDLSPVVDVVVAGESGRLTLAALGQKFASLVALAVYRIAEEALSGPEKKAAVLAAVGLLFDRLEGSFPIPIWLAPVWPWIRSPLRSAVLAIADGAIEVVVNLFLQAPEVTKNVA